MSKINSLNRINFFLGFFKQDVDKNEAVSLNGFVLFKHWDGNFKRWTVDLFTPESYKAMKEARSQPIQEERLL